MLRRGRRTAGLAVPYLIRVENKLLAAEDIIATKHNSERIMVFSETIESIQRLKEMLQNQGLNPCLLTAN